jgi:hypothetical protein
MHLYISVVGPCKYTRRTAEISELPLRYVMNCLKNKKIHESELTAIETELLKTSAPIRFNKQLYRAETCKPNLYNDCSECNIH